MLEFYGNKAESGKILKFSEPTDSAIPSGKEWCFFKFINDEIADDRPLLLNLKSAFLFGSDQEIVDFYVDDISDQHCVI